MANFNVRVPEEMAARFDAWAASEGGRSPALRRLIDTAATPTPGRARAEAKLPARPAKLTVRLAADDARGLEAAAREMGLTPNAWVAALVRRRLHDRPTLSRPEEVAVLAIQAELRRIGVNVNQIARALNTAVMEGKVLDLEIAWLDDLRTELRVHMSTLRDGLAGNLAYWQADP
jgi:predicted HicB family RNase H-like nuclease